MSELVPSLSGLPSRQRGNNLTPDLAAGVAKEIGSGGQLLLPPGPPSDTPEKSWATPETKNIVSHSEPEGPIEPLASQSNYEIARDRYIEEQKARKAGRVAIGLDKGTAKAEPASWDAPTGPGYHSPAEAIHADREKHKAEAQAAKIDSVTGLLSRNGLNEWFRDNRPPVAGVMLLDLKNFKEFNRIFDQSGGDAALKEAGLRLMASLRTGNKPNEEHPERRNVTAHDIVARDVDESDDMVAGRYGGDEFIAVIDLSEIPEASREHVMKKISERVADMGTFSLEGKEGELTLGMHSAHRISRNHDETLEDIYSTIKTSELKSDTSATPPEPVEKERFLSRILHLGRKRK